MGLHVGKRYSRRRVLPLPPNSEMKKEHSRSKIVSSECDDELVVRLPLFASSLSVLPDVTSFIVQLPLSSFSSAVLPDATSLYNRLTKHFSLPNGWNLSLIRSVSSTSPFLVVNKLQVTPPDYCCASQLFMLTIAPDSTWTVCVGSKQVNTDQCNLFSRFSSKLHTAGVVEIVSALEDSKFCVGNPDKKFTHLSERHGGVFMDYHGNILSIANNILKSYFPFLGLKTVAYYDSSYFPYPTIRHSDCQIIVSSYAADRCQQCEYYRYFTVSENVNHS